MLITNTRLVTLDSTLERGWVLCDGGRITALGTGEPPPYDGKRLDGGGAWLLPGMIDLHVHGAVGVEAMDAAPQSLIEMARFYAQHGVTSFLPTTWTDSRERILAALACIAGMVRRVEGGAEILGAHVEGPYLNPARCGAQDSRNIRRAEPDEALAFLDTGGVRLLALAPEYAENEWLIRECAQRGIAVSAAHTDATYADMQRAVALGVTQTTHTYNAMRGLHHREPGTLGAALTMPQLLCELVADNVHVHPAAQQLLWLAKGRDGVILVTDAVRAAGLPQGASYEQDGRQVVVRDAAYLPDGTLAGSATTMDRALANFATATGAALGEVWRAASLNPARAIGVADRKGQIAVGYDADMVLVDDGVNVLATVVGGDVIYRKVLY
jgi:N-acetylglucosamine-6-phosphate deacetylase